MCNHVWTAWTTKRERLGGNVETVTLVRTCVLCDEEQDARREPASTAQH
jgi:hypothetical protein